MGVAKQLTVSHGKVAIIAEVVGTVVAIRTLLQLLHLVELGVLRRAERLSVARALADAEASAQPQHLQGSVFEIEVIAHGKRFALTVAVQAVVPHRIAYIYRSVVNVLCIGLILQPFLHLASLAILRIVRVGIGILVELHYGIAERSDVNGKVVGECKLAHTVKDVEVAAHHFTV